MNHSTELTRLELEQTAELMYKLMQSVHDMILDCPDENEDEDDLDAALRLAVKAQGIAAIYDAHLHGTTKSGKTGLIFRLGEWIRGREIA